VETHRLLKTVTVKKTAATSYPANAGKERWV